MKAWIRVCLSVAVCCLAGCADQRIRDESKELIANGNFEQAIRTLEDATKQRPDSTVLRSGLVQAKAEVLAKLVSEAAQDRAIGNVDDAQLALERAQKLDPMNKRVSGLLADLTVERRQTSALQDAQALVDKKQLKAALATIDNALKDNGRHAGLLNLKRQLEAKQRQGQWAAAQQSLVESRPISLDFRDANLRTVLDLVSRNSGINFVFDKDLRTDVRTTVFINQARVEDALDLIISTNQLAKKVIDPKTVVIYPNTADKQREYQEQVLRVFYLASSDAKGAATFLKSMLKIKDPFIDERSNMLALRDSQENIELAERLINLYDAGEPEVLLEVEVMEVSTSRLTELGVKYPDTFSLTPLAPAGATGLTLGSARDITSDRIGLGISGLIVNLKREVGDVTTLANPKIRARNKEKAKILIGDKIPVVTTTAGNTGFVAENISYLDVGLKLDVEPTIYANDEVAINIALEVSSLGTATKTATGSIAYQIGTRNASTLLRLRDGETQLLAGLISKDDRTTSSRVPGLGDMPVLGRLFASQQDKYARTELVLAITPRILRNIRRPDASETELWIGTDAQPKLRPWGGLKGGLDILDVETKADNKPANSAEPAGAADPAKQVPPNPVELRWSGPTEARVGDVIDMQVSLNSVPLLRGMPLTFGLSPSVLALSDVVEGDYFRRDGVVTSFIKSSDGNTGQLSVGMLRSTATGTNGEGTVLTLRFKAVAAGRADLLIQSAQPLGLTGPADAPKLPPAWTVQVK